MSTERYIHYGCASFYFKHSPIVPTIQDLLEILQQISPDSLAEDWDNVGLLTGEPRQPLSRILLALDPVSSLIDQAKTGCYDCIITHHPAIFRPIKTLRADYPASRFLLEAVRTGINVIAYHTNLDSIQDGISDYLAKSLNCTNIRPLLPAKQSCPASCGLGRIGTCAPPVSPETFLAELRRVCNPPWILEAGPRPPLLGTVAVCGGSCSDLAETALQAGADVFVTAEVKHAVARWAEDAGLWLLDAGHFATEYPAMARFRETLLHQCVERGLNLCVDVAPQQSPLRLV